MSDPLLGEAGNANPEPAALGGTGGDEFTNLDGTAGSVAKAPRRRRRGSRGGRSRHGAGVLVASSADGEETDEPEEAVDLPGPALPTAALPAAALPASEDPPAAAVAKPKIGDTRPGSPPAPKRRARKEAGTGPAKVLAKDAAADGLDDTDDAVARVRLLGGSGAASPYRGYRATGGPVDGERAVGGELAASACKASPGGKDQGGRGRLSVAARLSGPWRRGGLAVSRASAADKASLERRNRPLGRYLMAVHVGPTATQIAVLEGRTLIEHYVSRPADDATQIDGNIYLGPGPERAARHGGGLCRYRHAEERRAVPRRPPLRRRRGRAAQLRRRRQADPGPPRGGGPRRPDRTTAPYGPKHHLPGDQEPDRDQGGTSHPGGLPARALRRADPRQRHLRHLQAPRRRRAAAPAQDPGRHPPRRPRPHRAHRRRGGECRRAGPRRRPLDAPVGAASSSMAKTSRAPAAALPGARPRRPGDPRGVQPRLPGRRDRRPAACTTR